MQLKGNQILLREMRNKKPNIKLSKKHRNQHIQNQFDNAYIKST